MSLHHHCSPESASASPALVVAITGGSGFLAAHLICWLQSRPNIAQIRTIDRKPFRPPFSATSVRNQLSCSQSPPSGSIRPPKLVHYQIDLLRDGAELERALSGVHVLIHLARKSMELLQTGNQDQLNERYKRDNLEATRALLDALFKCSVSRFLHVGDAYANLPPGDNFGTSEMIHCSLPSKYLLGAYGESRARAEMEGRERNGRQLPNGQIFHSLFLRPVLVYGEGDVKLPRALSTVAQRHGGMVHNLAGSSSGMKQFIYAGHLAQVIGEGVDLLMSDQVKRFSGEFFYCMDRTECTKFGKFCAPLVHSMGLNMGPSRKNWPTYFRVLCEEWMCWLTGRQPIHPDWSSTALQFLFGNACGFTNRKMALILRYRPEEEMAECVARTAEWIQQEMGSRIEDNTSQEQDGEQDRDSDKGHRVDAGNREKEEGKATRGLG